MRTLALSEGKAVGVTSDRRARARFPVHTPLRFTRGKMTGRGRTIDISSTGILFATDLSLPLGLRLDISIDWPVTLADGAPLQLTAEGIVTRASDGIIAVRMARAEFKTRRAAVD